VLLFYLTRESPTYFSLLTKTTCQQRPHFCFLVACLLYSFYRTKKQAFVTDSPYVAYITDVLMSSNRLVHTYISRTFRGTAFELNEIVRGHYCGPWNHFERGRHFEVLNFEPSRIDC